MTFSPTNPCRCGYDGQGKHQCHAGRNPLYPHGRCPNEAVERIVPVSPSYGSGLYAATYNTIITYYCPTCFAEAFPK